MIDMTADFDMSARTARVTGFVPREGSEDTVAVNAQLKW